MDRLTPQQRHVNMAAIRSKDTKPEMIVRRGLWSRGFRYRLNYKWLPGHPDLVLRKYRTCIFVNGCFWHAHLVKFSPNESSEFSVESLESVESGEKRVLSVPVYLPSANLHALFLLRHSMSNFASTGMLLRQLLDWAFFVEKHGKEIDWGWLEGQLEHFGMKRLYDVFNAICVGDLGFNVHIFPQVQFDPSLKERVLNDILEPEFSEKETGGFLRRAAFKYRRWKANAWKHELCFSESMWSAFWSGVKGHLMKPGMI